MTAIWFLQKMRLCLRTFLLCCSFETENKIRAKENAVLKNPNTIDEGIASNGFYEYIGPDGFMYRVDYTADENGFRPKLRRLETPYSGKWVLEKVN